MNVACLCEPCTSAVESSKNETIVANDSTRLCVTEKDRSEIYACAHKFIDPSCSAIRRHKESAICANRKSMCWICKTDSVQGCREVIHILPYRPRTALIR